MPSAVLVLPIDSDEKLFYTVPVSCIHNSCLQTNYLNKIESCYGNSENCSMSGLREDYVFQDMKVCTIHTIVINTFQFISAVP